MPFTRVITRKPGSDFAQGLTTANLGAPNYVQILEQHRAYIKTLEDLGVEVIVLEALPGYPDAYFVEDTAVVTPEIAVITIPGAQARRGETEAIEPVLARYREIAHIQPPGTVDGGDILQVEKDFFFGLSERTNLEGASQLGEILARYDYTWTPVPVAAGLHLKSSINNAGPSTLLSTPEFAAMELFRAFNIITLPPEEEYAANTLWLNDHLLMPRGFPETHSLLKQLGYPIIELDTSEIRKMDGGLTCLSLRL